MSRPRNQKPDRTTRDQVGRNLVVIPDEGIEIDLKHPWLAAFLAWLVPGLGHIYQGRTSKGILFMVCILGTFFYGLYLGGYTVVYASTPGQQPYRWQYWCQLPSGAVTLPAAIQRHRQINGESLLFGGIMAPPKNQGFTTEDYSGNEVRHPDELSRWQHDRPFLFDLGTVYTMIAGLLNVLVIYDAAAGPFVMIPEVKPKRGSDRKRKGEKEPPSEDTDASGPESGGQPG